MSSPFRELSRRLDGVQRLVSGSSARAMLGEVGKRVAPEVGKATRADIGDVTLDGGRRRKPTGWSKLPMSGGFDVTSATSLEVRPSPLRRANGPMRVLQDGRKAYSAGDRRAGGMRKLKTGEQVTKYRKVTRNVGVTRGKRTWDHATERLRAASSQACDDVIAEAVRAQLGGGGRGR